MRVQLLIKLTIVLGVVNLNAQTILTKDEIINSWKLPEPDSSDLRQFSSDVKQNANINSLVDSLTKSGIDTIIIYTTGYPGSIIVNSCYGNIYPIDAYILWPTKGKLNFKRLKGKCKFNIVTCNSSAILNYFNENKAAILSEKIMPVILNAQQTSSRISYSMILVSHEPNYRLQLRIGKTLKILYFTDSYLENKESLFHEYNKQLKTIELWKLIEYEIPDKP